jgi:hypothetical protein
VRQGSFPRRAGSVPARDSRPPHRKHAGAERSSRLAHRQRLVPFQFVMQNREEIALVDRLAARVADVEVLGLVGGFTADPLAANFPRL